MLVTSPGLPEMVTPFSLGMLLELLLGELGPEPGALLHADSTKYTHSDLKSSKCTGFGRFGDEVRLILSDLVFYYSHLALTSISFFN